MSKPPTDWREWPGWFALLVIALGILLFLFCRITMPRAHGSELPDPVAVDYLTTNPRCANIPTVTRSEQNTTLYPKTKPLHGRPLCSARWVTAPTERLCVVIGAIMPEMVKCTTCGKEFYVKPHDAKRNHNFCGRTCYGVYRAEHFRGSDNPAWAGGAAAITCKQCGVKFDVIRSKQETARFCSRECQGKWASIHRRGSAIPNWKGGPVEVVCEECGSLFMRPQCHVIRSKHNFCSQKCFGSRNSKTRVGEAAPWWRGGKLDRYGIRRQSRLATMCRERDGQACQKCGAAKQLCTHHIKPLQEGGKDVLANMITMCRSCHSSWHHAHRKGEVQTICV